MKKIVAGLIFLIVSMSSNAVEFIKFSSRAECDQVQKQLWEEKLKNDVKNPLSTKGVPKHWIRSLPNDPSFKYVDDSGSYPTAPDGTSMGGGAYLRGDKIVHIICRIPNYINGNNPTQWMAISTIEEDRIRHKAYWDKIANEKQNAKDFLKNKGL
jgi:hypothetical protein